MALRDPILPPSTIGILGGGQLGKMIGMEALRMGYRLAVLDPSRDAPALAMADPHVANFHDALAVRRLADQCDVLTFEFENVDPSVMDSIDSRPSLEPLYVSRNRWREKSMARSLGIKTADFFAVDSAEELAEAMSRPEITRAGGAILKTCEGGYDGKGQWKLGPTDASGNPWSLEQSRLPMDLEKAFLEVPTVAEGPRFILECLVDFRQEFSIVGAGFNDGSFVSFSPIINEHVNGVLHRSRCSADLDGLLEQSAAQTAKDAAESIAKHFQYCGTFAVEFFDTKSGIVFNEMAPRPHNSGHLTLDNALTSQFEQHVRAICGLPPGSPGMHSSAVMINILGSDDCRLDGIEKALSIPGVRLHLYGKLESRSGRKMGHLVALDPDLSVAVRRADEAFSQLRWVKQ